MLKKIKLQNSTILLIGILFIIAGIFIGFSDYLDGKKNKVFSEKNILLYENEIPKIIESDYQTEEKEEKEETEEREETEEVESKSQIGNQYNYIGIIEIPKINVKRGFLDINSRYNNVDYNVTVINGSTFPDQENSNLILAAHSGPCSYCYFDKLYKLSIGDSAYISYNNVKYHYKIVNIYEVEKDGTVTVYRDYSKNVLTLITCTRNSDTKQTVYILELFSKE